MTIARFEQLPSEAQDALWEIAQSVLDMTASDQYLAKVSTGQVVAHLALNAHDDHVPGAQVIMAACKFINVVETAAMKDGAA